MTGRAAAALAIVLALSGGCAGSTGVPGPPALDAGALLERGGDQLAAGDLPAAEATLRRLERAHPGSPEAAQLLFELAAARLDPARSERDADAALAMLERVRTQYAGSSWASAAELALQLARERDDAVRSLAVLERQLDELKRLDLSTDG